MESINLNVIIPSADEPVSLDEAKSVLKITSAQEDNVLQNLISSSRQAVENYINQSIMTQVWRLNTREFSSGEVKLFKGPVQEILAVSWVQSDNTDILLTNNEYDISDDYLILYKIPNSCQHLEVLYKAGYSHSPADIPDIYKQAILAELTARYTCDCSFGSNELSPNALSLMKPYRAIHL